MSKHVCVSLISFTLLLVLCSTLLSAQLLPDTEGLYYGKRTLPDTEGLFYGKRGLHPKMSNLVFGKRQTLLTSAAGALDDLQRQEACEQLARVCAGAGDWRNKK